MKKGLWLGTFFSIGLFSFSVTASPLTDKAVTLQAAIKADKSDARLAASTTLVGISPSQEAAAKQVLSQLTSGQSDRSPDNYTIEIVYQIMAAHPSDDVQKAGHDLLDEIQAEIKAKADAYAAGVDAALAQLKDIIPKATKPSDLDDVLVQLQKYEGVAYSSGDDEAARRSQAVAYAFQFATGWQDYLAAVARGNVEEARSQLRSLAQNSYGITIVPRSRIIELENTPIGAPSSAAAQGDQGATPPAPAPTVDSILDQVKTLDQMDGALKQINALNLPYGSAETQNIQTLQNYVQCYHDIQAGLPANLNLSNGIQGLPGHEDLTRQVWLLALQSLFSSFKGGSVPGEKPLDYVDRVIAAAAGREDWDMLKKGLEAKDQIMKSTQFGLHTMDPASGLNSLIAALNQEAAGQYSLAVASYEAALKSPSLDIPAKMIGEKLAAIQKDHPTEFQTGYQQTISPPMSSPYPYPGGMPFRPGMPGYPYPGRMPGGSVLSIPGRSNTAPIPGPLTNTLIMPGQPTLSPTTPAPSSPSPSAPAGK